MLETEHKLNITHVQLLHRLTDSFILLSAGSRWTEDSGGVRGLVHRSSPVSSPELFLGSCFLPPDLCERHICLQPDLVSASLRPRRRVAEEEEEEEFPLVFFLLPHCHVPAREEKPWSVCGRRKKKEASPRLLFMTGLTK